MTDRLIYLDDKKYDISGPAGNAFAVLGNVLRLLKQCKVDQKEIDSFLTEAQSGDYNNLLRVCHDATGIEFVNRSRKYTEWLN